MENVIIIGTGCAGWTSAIYTARANLSPLVLAGEMIGGQLTTTTEVENFPGFPDGIEGPDLMMRMQKQAEKFKARVVYENALSVKKQNDGTIQVNTSGGNKLISKSVIIATGAKPKYLGLDNEKSLIGGKGVTSCATCDGAFYPNVPVCVVGGGDSACEEALFLTKYASKVYLIHRRDTLRASKIMADRVLSNDKIEPIWNSEITRYITDEEGVVKKVNILNKKNNQESKLEVKCVFVAIGHIPNTSFLSESDVALDDEGYILKKQETQTQTNVDGIFCCGDVADTVYRQAITASGNGCQAAIDVEKYISHL